MEKVIVDEMPAAWPPEAQAVVRLLRRKVVALEAEVADLKARLDKNWSNSSLSPSATHPHAKPSKQSIRKARRRGVRGPMPSSG
jgi:transposase